MVLDRQTQIELYTTMLTIRRFEERVVDGVLRRQHLRLRPLLHRAGGHRHRRLRAPEHGRPHRQQPPRPRPLHRQGRRHEADDGRDLRQEDRLLQGQGRFDAHRRLQHRHAGGGRHRRRRAAHRRRRGAGRPARRRGDTSRRSSSATAPARRASSTRRSIWPPSGSCPSSSSARTTTTGSTRRPRTALAPGTSPGCRGLSHPEQGGRRQRRRGRLRGGRRGGRHAPAAAKAPTSWSARPIAGTSTSSPTHWRTCVRRRRSRPGRGARWRHSKPSC